MKLTTTTALLISLALSGCDSSPEVAREGMQQQIDTIKQEADQTAADLKKAGVDQIKGAIGQDLDAIKAEITTEAVKTAEDMKQAAIEEARRAAYEAVGLTPPTNGKPAGDEN